MADLSKIPDRWYLADNNSQNYDFYCDLYFGEHWRHFPINEFNYSLTSYSYVAYNLVRFCIDTLVNLYGINSMEVSFSSNQEDFERIRATTNLDTKLEILLRDYYVYGNSYLALTSDEDGVNIQNLPPKTVYADYYKYNPEKPAKKYTTYIEEKLDEEGKEKVYLLIDYYNNRIELSSWIYCDKNWKQVQVDQYFEELIPSQYTVRDDYIVIDVEFDPLIALHGEKQNGFYGKTSLSTTAISLQELVNKMGNLAKFAISQNAVPKLKLSESAAKLLENIIEDRTTGDRILDPVPSLLNTPQQTSFRTMTWLNSAVLGEYNKKLMFYREDGRGSTEYLVNDYKLDDLFRLQNESETKFLKEMNVSPAFYNPELGSKLASGTAYKRLMQNTIAEVENMRSISKNEIAQVLQGVMKLSGYNVELPEIEFMPVILSDDLTKTPNNALNESNVQQAATVDTKQP